MDSPQKSCTNCSRPVPIGVESDLCEICSATSQTADTHTSPPPEFDSQTGSGSIHLSDLPLPPGGSRSTTGFPLPTGEPPSDPVLIQPNPPGYELLGEISRGGMGVVYLARSLARKDLFVAAKFLLDPTNLSTFRRFQEEVKASPLQSDHVVKVVGGDTAANPPYFLMEVCGGGTLARRVKDGGPLDPKLAARWMKAVAAAVAEVHARHVIHRDIKPGNILLARRDGRDEDFVRLKGTPKRDESPFNPDDYIPKLSDFGLAKNLDTSHGLTGGSVPMGTAPYMPPEQVLNPQSGEEDERVGIRSDVYSLGATLYHLVCGRPPFEGTTLQVMNAALRDDPVRPCLVRKECPPELEAIIVKAMEKKPGNRYESAKKLAEDLDDFIEGRKVKAPQLTPLRRAWRAVRRRQKAVAAGAAACVFAAGVIAAAPKPMTVREGSNPIVVERDDREAMRRERDVIHAQLKDGKPAELLSPSDRFRWYDTTTGTVIQDPDPEGGVRLTARGLKIIRFLDPPIDAYTVEFDIKQSWVEENAIRFGNSSVGFFAGYQSATAADGWAEVSVFGCSYTDLHRTPVDGGGEAVVRVDSHCHITPFGQRRSPLPAVFDQRTFAAHRALPGPWRTVRIDASPDRVALSWKTPRGKFEPLATADRETLRGWFARREKQFAVANKDFGRAFIPLADWSPRQGVGVWANETEVSIRKLTVTPSVLTPQ